MTTMTNTPSLVPLLTRFVLPVGLLLSMIIGWLLPQWWAWQDSQSSMVTNRTMVLQRVDHIAPQSINCKADRCWEGTKAGMLVVLNRLAQQRIPLWAFDLTPVTNTSGPMSYQLKVWVDARL